MNVMWVRIRSWHALSGTRTVCGRQPALNAEVSDALPGAKSCETCLRLLARRVDG